jgi:hypothetical protein
MKMNRTQLVCKIVDKQWAQTFMALDAEVKFYFAFLSNDVKITKFHLAQCLTFEIEVMF